MFFFLAQTEQGDIFKVTLETDEEMVKMEKNKWINVFEREKNKRSISQVEFIMEFTKMKIMISIVYSIVSSKLKALASWGL